jgi:hypothetical protein
MGSNELRTLFLFSFMIINLIFGVLSVINNNSVSALFAGCVIGTSSMGLFDLIYIGE